MSEEHPIFKVTDRRLFNADGTPREGAREEETKTEAAAVETKESAPTTSESRPDASTQEAQTATESIAAAAATPSSAQTEQGSDSAVASNEASAVSSASVVEQFPEEDFAESEIPGADDPASFINFLMSIASNAAAALGMMEHPVTGQRAVDPELGKHWIDVLGMLEQKTRGNLASQEQQIFEGLLADLRMQYVSLTSTRPAPKAPRGFSGSDITGGR
ncbi:MAG: hypothetical protein QOH63_3158 [Acidobacteriota bacterium]|jgi:hypothetical protein|nr:hypothetical protein [Acidobacteriota bacterium]